MSISLKNLKNAEVGKRCFILANGPSVLKEDLSLLKDELVIGMNASTILDKEHGFFSKYYVVSDMRFLSHEDKRKYGTTELNKETIRIFREELKEIDDKSLDKQTCYVKALGKNGFSNNLNVGFYFGSTTTMLAIQLAFYLGCTEIYLLGVDLKYSKDNPRFYEEKNPQLEDSFTSVQIRNIADAVLYCKERGVKLYSCSENSFLRPYVPYIDYKELF